MKIKHVAIAFFALALGLSQCRQPVLPEYDIEELKDISFTAYGGGGSKGDFTDSDGSLTFTWDADDELHVYVCKDKGSFNPATGRYLGSLKNTTGEGSTASFFGRVRVKKDDEYFRFVYVGKIFSVNDSGESTLDYSSQTGILDNGSNGLGEQILAYIDMPYSEDMGGKMNVYGAIFAFDLTSFSTGTVTMSNAGYHKITLNTYGGIVPSEDGNVTLALAGINDKYCTILLPTTNPVTITFSKSGETTRYVYVKSISESKYYTSENGSGIKPLTGFSSGDLDSGFEDGF